MHLHAEHIYTGPHPGQPLIELCDVGMGWDGRMVLEGINMDVRRGDFITITGPNGGGKTTLLRIILGLLRPARGRVVRHYRQLRTGYLPQKNMIDSHFPVTVREVIESGLLGVKGMSADEHSARYAAAITKVGLEEHAARPIGLLSGGQLQRALLARAIVAGPQLLVLDEPLSYIDVRFEERLVELVGELARTTTVIMVTHQMTALAELANRHFVVDRTIHECTAHHHFFRTDCE